MYGNLKSMPQHCRSAGTILFVDFPRRMTQASKFLRMLFNINVVANWQSTPNDTHELLPAVSTLRRTCRRRNIGAATYITFSLVVSVSSRTTQTRDVGLCVGVPLPASGDSVRRNDGPSNKGDNPNVVPRWRLNHGFPFSLRRYSRVRSPHQSFCRTLAPR